MKTRIIIVVLGLYSSVGLMAQCINYTITTTQTGTCSEAAGNQTYSNSSNGNVITLTVDGNFTINGDFTVERENVVINGTLTINGDYDQERGSITINGTLIVNGDYTQTRGTMVNNGTMTTTGQFFSGFLSGVTIADGGTINAGSLTSGLGAVFTVEDGGYLNVTDDLSTGAFAGFVVDEGGVVDVGGDFITGGGANNTVNGTMDIVGNYTSLDDNSTLQGDGDMTVGGTYDNGGGDDSGFSGSLNEAPLPVELLSFNAYPSKDFVQVEWETASEVNNMGFEVEVSRDGLHYAVIGFIEGNGTTNQKQLYDFRDTGPRQGVTFYRLKQIDFDGKYEYSPIVRVDYNVIARKVEVFPNPTFGEVRFNQVVTNYSLFDTEGKMVLHKEFASTSQIEIELSEYLQKARKGVYYLQVNNPEGIQSLRLVKK